MKFFLIIVFTIKIVLAEGSDWDDKSSWATQEIPIEDNEVNILYEKAKIQNRANLEYTDRVYKYITGDYTVENNDIELASIQLNDNLQDRDIEVNTYVDNLDVEGNRYKDNINLRKNSYKNYVNRDENHLNLKNDFLEDNGIPRDYNALNSDYGEDEENTFTANSNISSPIRYEDPLYTKVKDRDVSELEILDFRDLNALREVNILVEDVNIIVK